MNDHRIDGEKLVKVLTEAADAGYRLALSATSGAEKRTGTHDDMERQVDLIHRFYVRQALELVPSSCADLVEPPIYWSIQEMLEWLVWGRDEGGSCSNPPPLTWRPFQIPMNDSDSLVRSRLELLRAELADEGFEVTPVRWRCV